VGEPGTAAVFSDALFLAVDWWRFRLSNLETSFWVLGEEASRPRGGLVIALSGLEGVEDEAVFAVTGYCCGGSSLAGDSFALPGDLGVVDGAIVREEKKRLSLRSRTGWMGDGRVDDEDGTTKFEGLFEVRAQAADASLIGGCALSPTKP